MTERDLRIHTWGLGIIVVAAVIHHCALFLWYVDDAAITFAYARNLAFGEGLVPFVGGERVEGYSNPAWTFFLVPFAFVGLDLVASVRWIQLLLVIATIGVTYLAAREAMAHLDGDEAPHPLTRHAPLLAPALLAVSAQFSTWTGAGLEIALMDLFMALAIWRSLIEWRTGEWPWSAALWLGVALSRPEAILYAAAAGFCAMVVQFRAGRGLLPTAKWLLTFFLPMGLYQAWRLMYFGWEFPNTYYAKLERRPSFPLLDWQARTWRYTRNFAHNMGWGFFAPIWTLGAMGFRSWRWSAALGVAAVGALVIAAGTSSQRLLLPAVVFAVVVGAWFALDRSRATPRAYVGVLVTALLLVGVSEALQAFWGFVPAALPLPKMVFTVPPYVLVGMALTLFVLSFDDRNVPARSLVLSLCLAAVFFALIAQWDWMKGYRWYAPAVVPGAILFAMGLHHFAMGMAERLGGLFEGPRFERSTVALAVVGMVVLAAIPPNVIETIDRVRNPDPSPRGVLTRARYMQKVERRLHLEERARDLEVDMGGHMYWTDFEMVDIAGLVDVPMGHHKFAPAFIDEYLFREQLPHFVHLHNTWERNSRIKKRPYWRNRGYIEITPYLTGGGEWHGGNHVRRDIVLPKTWPHGGTPVQLDKGTVLHGVHVPSDPPEGGKLYVEVGIAQLDEPGQDDFRLWLVATNGAVVVRWDLDPGYSWIDPTEWMDDEIFHGRYTLRMPESLRAGTYDLGLMVLGADGTMRSPADDPEAVQLDVGTLAVLTPEVALAEAERDRDRSLEQAESGSCKAAEDWWFQARKHQAGNREWRESQDGVVRRAMAECWARKSEGQDRASKVQALIRAREHDHWAPAYRVAARALAGQLYAEGHVARDAEDWEGAYRAFADAVAVDRSWSWARRYAEEARAHRLGLWPKEEDQTAAR
ncbi:MAG: hypothetical protein AAGA48_37325 [Myxococcota bacterium]